MDTNPRDDFNLMIAGEAGQGLATFGELVVKALVRSGYYIVVTQSYHSRIRGGHNTFAVRLSTEPISTSRDALDLLVAMNSDGVRLHHDELAEDGIALADEKLDAEGARLVKVPFSELAPGKFANTAGLGVVAALIGLDQALVDDLVQEQFGKKHPETADSNRTALENGYAWGREHLPRAGKRVKPATRPDTPRLALNGNQAIALGALSAGVRFVSFYPMTPSTSIPLTLIAAADKMGVAFEQAEDEIAAINMAIGASFTGAPAMVATSGGGFALMVEGVSLAAMTETPIVVVVAQRPGPATGLPTRTEQGDLELVLHAGHGEFPRALYAPGSVEQCFHLTREAFLTAEASQGPVFILTDQFLADSFRAVDPFEVDGLETVPVPVDAQPVALPYRRYQVTDSGVSPRLLPGFSEHLVQADSDEHDEQGHITEDHGVRIAQVDKRLRKLDVIHERVIPPDASGDPDPDLLLVCWGSAKGAVEDAAAQMRAEGRSVATLHFPQVWPLVPEQFVPALEAARRVICCEGNATGQFARLIRRETGFHIADTVLRYDGLPLTPEYILERCCTT